MKYDYDIIVVGGGAAGLIAAKTAASFGKNVAIIEKAKLSGSCTWTGCVPSKALIKSAETAYFAHQFKKRGLQGTCDEIDSSYVMKHLHHTIERVYLSHNPEQLLKLKIGTIHGSPYFNDDHTVTVDGKKISFEKAIIATGSRSCIPQVAGSDTVTMLTNETFFSLEKLPKSMIILGGGPNGCEIASAANRLGSKITVVEGCPQLLPRADHECVEIVTDIMRKEGVTIITDARVIAMNKDGAGVSVTYANPDGSQATVKADALYAGAGRIANSDGMNLEALGICMNRGFIKADDSMLTAVSNFYTAGDVTGPYLFVHSAWHQGATAAYNACVPVFKKKIDNTNLVWVTFTSPEIAGVGLTEPQARECCGNDIQIFTMPYADLDRAIMDVSEVGLGKFIVDGKGRLVGAHIVGERAGELISAVQIGKTADITLKQLSEITIPYPTYTELIWHLARKAYSAQRMANPLLGLGRKLFFK